MPNRDSASTEERLRALEHAVDRIERRLDALFQGSGGPRPGDAPGIPTAASPPFVPPFPPTPPFAPKPVDCRYPFSFPPQRFTRPCDDVDTVIEVPTGGSYLLTINVAAESDCTVVVRDSDDRFAFRPVAPGNSRSTRFDFDRSLRLLVDCRGKGTCSAEITLTQLA